MYKCAKGILVIKSDSNYIPLQSFYIFNCKYVNSTEAYSKLYTLCIRFVLSDKSVHFVQLLNCKYLFVKLFIQ